MKEINAEAHAMHERVRAKRKDRNNKPDRLKRAIDADGAINLILPLPEGVTEPSKYDPGEISYDPGGCSNHVFMKGWFTLEDVKELGKHMEEMKRRYPETVSAGVT